MYMCKINKHSVSYIIANIVPLPLLTGQDGETTPPVVVCDE